MREQDWVAWLQKHAPTGRFGSSIRQHGSKLTPSSPSTNQVADFVPSDLMGDDAAALPSSAPIERSLICADMIVEGVHFHSPDTPPELIGRKALAVNLSDIAAMGGYATHATVTISVPHAIKWSYVEQIYAGLFALAQQYNVAIVGGDTTRWQHPLTISVTVCGVAGPSLWRRSGARSGDQLFVSGELGGSLSGKHLSFEPRLNLAAWLQSKSIEVHACIDISDGLGLDLERVCEASRCGAIVQASKLPVAKAALDAAAVSGKTPLDHALSDGEDFELLLAIRSSSAQQLTQLSPPVPLSWIGEITESRARLLIGPDGTSTPLLSKGYDHLAREN